MAGWSLNQVFKTGKPVFPLSGTEWNTLGSYKKNPLKIITVRLIFMQAS